MVFIRGDYGSEVISPTEIIVTVPEGASTGRITLTAQGGLATSATDFIIGTLPLVTGSNPSVGSVTASTVNLYDPITGQATGTPVPFPGFTGEVRVATGDFNQDGISETIAAAGPGGGPHVKVFDYPNSLDTLYEFFSGPQTNPDGVFVS